jgi:hypothetical protein
MFAPENDLERLLIRSAAEPDQRTSFLKTLAKADLILALIDSGDAREGYIVPEVTHEDDVFVPIFTSDARVEAMFGDEKLMIVRQTLKQIAEQIDDAHFVLNPGSEHGREFMAEDVAAILRGDFAAVAAEGFERGSDDGEGGPPTLVGRPNPLPVHLTAPLAALFATLPEVRAAHVAQAVEPDPNGVKRLVIGLAADGDVDAIFDKIGDVLEEVARPSDVIDFVTVPGSPLDVYFERDTQPFYKKA